MEMIKEYIKKILKSILILVSQILPINNRKMILWSYYGKQYSCNPKYITEYIINNCDYDIIWAFDKNYYDKVILPSGVRKVKMNTIKYFYELFTSKIIITNCRTSNLFVKKKGQYYIQTWHSSLRLKHIEKDAISSLPKQYIKNAKVDSKKCDLILSGCKKSTEILKKSFWYDGEILECGIPRNDILFNSNTISINNIKQKLNIPESSKIIMYAPTFRKNEDLTVYSLNWDMILSALEGKFHNEWVVLFRLHPNLMDKIPDLKFNDKIINATNYSDIQELLTITDILVTDYSSVMFDFALTKRPCFLYTPDLNQYIKNDRGLYFNYNELPFRKSSNIYELLECIKTFDDKKYKTSLDKFLTKIKTFEAGEATKTLVKKLELLINN